MIALVVAFEAPRCWSQLFIIFFALPQAGIKLDPFPAAVIAFSINVGGYAAEIIRSAIQSIPKGQWEAAETIGFNYVGASSWKRAPPTRSSETPGKSCNLYRERAIRDAHRGESGMKLHVRREG